jgi:uncharacterized protein (TIGR02145 family)
VKVDNQTWMAENLNFNANGSKCYGEGGRVLTSWDEKTETYKDTTTLSKAEIQANCNKYGRLYDWETAKKVCPSGWHLPSNAEWQTLVDIAGGDEIAGKRLKARSGWNSDNGKSGNGTDDYGFAALPGGLSNSGGSGCFGDVGFNGVWWTTTEGSAYNAYYNRYIGCCFAGVDSDYDDKTDLYSVRCVKD